MGTISKDNIKKWIIPQLSEGKRGQKTSVCLVELVEAILYRLKTGTQWRELPVKQFFSLKESGKILSWNSVFHHFNKWSKDGSWEKVWLNFLKSNRQYLDMSSTQMDGSHTPAKRGGEAVAYQNRKSCKTTNALFIADNQGVILAMSTPQAGNHHDLFEIKTLFNELCDLLKMAEIDLDGLFLNADPGFDSKALKELCEAKGIMLNVKPNKRNKKDKKTEVDDDDSYIFDEDLYKDRSVIEHSNAWIDAFKTLLVRFETSLKNWISFHFLAFFVIFIRKIKL